MTCLWSSKGVRALREGFSAGHLERYSSSLQHELRTTPHERAFTCKIGSSNHSQWRRISSLAADFTFDPPRAKKWAQWEDELLTNMRQRNISPEQIAAELQRSIPSVQQRIWRLRKPSFPPRKWHQGEVDALFQMHKSGFSIEDICQKLQRSRDSVGSRLQKPSVQASERGHFTQGELDQLFDMHQRGDSPHAIASQLQRTPRSIRIRLSNPFLGSYPLPKPWTDDDKETLARLESQGTPKAEIAVYMGRTLASISSRSTPGAVERRKKGGVPFSSAESEKLLQLHTSGKAWKEILEEMPGRGLRVLKARLAKLMGDQGPNRVMYYAKENYSKAEDALLLKLYGEGQSSSAIAHRLNRSRQSVWGRNKRINPEYQRTHHVWTREEEETISRMRMEGKEWDEVMMNLGPHRTKQAARNRYYQVLQKRVACPVPDGKAVTSPSRSLSGSTSVTLAPMGGKRGYATITGSSPPFKAKCWTPEELDTLLRLRQEGRSWPEIAFKLGRIRGSVRVRAGRQSPGEAGPTTIHTR